MYLSYPYPKRQSLMMSFFGNDTGTGLKADGSYLTHDVLGIKKSTEDQVIGSVLPWSKAGKNPSTSKFMPPVKILPLNWDQLYPYRLIVVDASKNNAIVGGDPNQQYSKFLQKSGDNFVINFQPILSDWVFVLPITPQQLAITDQFAITTTATLRGVVEEHNGVKFKMISASGTMGVWPYRETVTHSPTSPGLIRSLFGGTLEALDSVVTGVTNTVNALLKGTTASKPITIKPKDSQAGSFSTGYYSAMTLQQFLEQYAEAKKSPVNAGWRLVFDIPKQNQSFIVSPIQFNWQQNVNKPVEINYTFQLKAWRRISLANKAPAAALNINQVSPGLIQTLLNTISAARVVMSKSTNLLHAVRSDIDKPLEVLRQTSLLLKDAGGVATTAADLPKQIVKDYKSPLKDYWYANLNTIQANNPSAKTKELLGAIRIEKYNTEGLSQQAIANGQIGAFANNLQNISPSNQIFDNPAANFEILDAAPTAALNLNTAQQNQLNTIFDQTKLLTVDDLKQFRNVISDLSYQISNYYGASTAFYNNVYGKAAPKTRIQPLSTDEYEILNSLYGAIEAYDIITATSYVDDVNKKTNMEYVAGLASDSDIPFSLPNSKIVVPVPYGLTIEGIALRYLNDAQRWLEIVTLNNLKEPYIDETGFQKPLLSNGSGREITVSDSTNLYIGQTITLKSITAVPSPRKITGLDILSDSSVLITVDGLANLENFTTLDKAYIQAYLPGTVNSQQKIFIPSDLVAQDPDNISIPSAVAGDPLVGLSKVDFLMTDNGDIATNNYGDFRLSSGMTNLIQALKIKLGTIKGTMVLHPDFGLGIRAGMSTADFTADTVYATINKLIVDDPRFSGIKTLQIQLNKASLTINLTVFLANNSGILPLTFDLNI